MLLVLMLASLVKTRLYEALYTTLSLRAGRLKQYDITYPKYDWLKDDKESSYTCCMHISTSFDSVCQMT